MDDCRPYVDSEPDDKKKVSGPQRIKAQQRYLGYSGTSFSPVISI